MQFIKISGGSKPYRQALVDDLMKSVTNSYVKYDNATRQVVKHALDYYGSKATVILVEPEFGVESFLIESSISASVILVTP